MAVFGPGVALSCKYATAQRIIEFGGVAYSRVRAGHLD